MAPDQHGWMRAEEGLPEIGPERGDSSPLCDVVRRHGGKRWVQRTVWREQWVLWRGGRVTDEIRTVWTDSSGLLIPDDDITHWQYMPPMPPLPEEVTV